MSKEINAHVRTLADSLKASMTGGENGAVVADAAWYAGSLPEGIKIETVNTLQEHNTAVTAAAAVAMGEYMAPIFEANKDLKEATTFVAVGADRIPVTVVRDYTHGKEQYHGHVTLGYEVNATGPHAGQVTIATAHVRSMYDALLG